jgi:hypothetical protein
MLCLEERLAARKAGAEVKGDQWSVTVFPRRTGAPKGVQQQLTELITRTADEALEGGAKTVVFWL